MESGVDHFEKTILILRNECLLENRVFAKED